MPNTPYKGDGDYTAYCDICGFRYYASQLKMRWDNFLVCTKDYEDRNPQDFIYAHAEQTSVPIARSDPTTTIDNEADIFVDWIQFDPDGTFYPQYELADDYDPTTGDMYGAGKPG